MYWESGTHLALSVSHRPASEQPVVVPAIQRAPRAPCARWALLFARRSVVMQPRNMSSTASPGSRSAMDNPAAKSYHGDGREIILQGFHWDSYRGSSEKDQERKSWYRIVKDCAP